jgi:hypothetical protein
MAGQKWPSIYQEIFGDRWKYRQKERDKLRRNANIYLKKRMRQEGFPAGMSTTEWIGQRQKTHSQTQPTSTRVLTFGKGTPTSVD